LHGRLPNATRGEVLLTTLNYFDFAGIDLGHVDPAPIVQLGLWSFAFGPSDIVERVVIAATVLAVADKTEDRWGVNGELGLPAGAMDCLAKERHAGCSTCRCC
jgi:hypothetical protein